MRCLIRPLIVVALVALPSVSVSRHLILAQAATADPFKTRAIDAPDDSRSPDGASAVWHKDGSAGRLFARDVKTGAERVLVDLDGTVDHLVWSPDSRRLAFTFTPKAPPTPEVRVVTVATGTSRTLAAPGSVLAWTARNEILVSAQHRGWPNNVEWSLVPAADGASRIILTPAPDAGGISADGASLIFGALGALPGRIVLYQLETGLERTLTAIDASEQFLALSPDGRLLAFASDMDGGWAVYVAPLDRLPVTRPLRIGHLDGRPASSVASWTRSGVLALQRVTYSATAPYRVDVDAKTGRALGVPRRLTNGPFDTEPVVSPDGTQLKYWFNNRRAAVGVGVVDICSGATRRVLSRPSSSVVRAFAWRSPEEVLLYDGDAEPEGFAALNVKTGALLPLVPATIDRHGFVYVPGTQEVLYASGNDNTKGVILRARALAGGAERVVATIDFLTDFRASPDGRHIVYDRWLEAPGPGRQPGSELRLITIDGAPEKLLLATPRGSQTLATWSPDGRFLLYFDWDDVPRVMNVDTLEFWSLLDSANQPEWWYDEATWAPDGSYVVLTGVGTWQQPHPAPGKASPTRP